MKKIVYFVLIFLFSCSAFAQNKEEYNFDSLSLDFHASRDTITSVKKYVDQIRAIYRIRVPKDKIRFKEFIQDILALAKKIDDKEGSASASYYLARYYIGEHSEYSKALPRLLESMAVFEEIGDSMGVSRCYMQLGVISYSSSYFEDAVKNFKLSVKYAKNPTATYLLAISYSELNNFIESKKQFHLAINTFKDLNRAQSMNECYMYLGRLYTQEAELDSAYYYLSKGLEGSKKFNNDERLSRPFALISEYYLEKGILDTAEFYALSSMEITKNRNDNLSPMISSNVLSKVYEKQKKYNKAYEYLKLHYSLKNEDFEGGVKQKIAEVQTIFEFKKKIEAGKLEHQEEIRMKNQTKNIILIIGLFILLVAGGLWSRLNYVRKTKASLQKEKNISESLLLNILPAEIAQELKENGEAKARDFDLAPVLFTDFKGFTEQSASLSASELVSEINHCFKGFDHIIEKYGIEKIKTIGDSYMAAGGLPIPTKDSVKNTVLAALEMQSFIISRKTQMDKENKPAFEMRVGIHAGPVVAGIVGVKKFQYDIWGDTVNTASRMESNGEVGKVNISQATYELLTDTSTSLSGPLFSFESRGKMEVKGKGEMEMWFVSLS